MIPLQVTQVIWDPGVTSKYFTIRLYRDMSFRIAGMRWRNSAFCACSNELGNAPPGIL